jgi:hypothetical protein
VVRVLTDGTFVRASALAAAALAVARAAAIANRLVSPGGAVAVRTATDPLRGTPAPGGRVQISWTRVEVRWVSPR